MDWTRLLYRDKLQAILDFVTLHRLDVLVTTDLHSFDIADGDYHVVHVEGFLWVMTRRVGILLGPAARASWNLSGRRLGVEGERNLQLLFDDAILGRFTIGAIYVPTLDYGAAEREAALHDCDRLAERLLDRPDDLLLVCGDWHGHISRERAGGLCLGDKGMRKYTSVNGRVILAWRRGKSYKQVDSFPCCADRGTWTSSDAWHEIDYFVTTQSDRSSFNNLACIDVGVGDHKMKVVEMRLTSITSLTRRRQRRAKFAAIEEQRKLRLSKRPRLRTDLLAGNSD